MERSARIAQIDLEKRLNRFFTGGSGGSRGSSWSGRRGNYDEDESQRDFNIDQPVTGNRFGSNSSYSSGNYIRDNYTSLMDYNSGKEYSRRTESSSQHQQWQYNVDNNSSHSQTSNTIVRNNDSPRQKHGSNCNNDHFKRQQQQRAYGEENYSRRSSQHQQWQYGDDNYSRNHNSKTNDRNKDLPREHQQRRHGDDNFSHNQNSNASDYNNYLFSRQQRPYGEENYSRSSSQNQQWQYDVDNNSPHSQTSYTNLGNDDSLRRLHQQGQNKDNNYSRDHNSKIGDGNKDLLPRERQQRWYGDDNFSRNQHANASDCNNDRFTRHVQQRTYGEVNYSIDNSNLNDVNNDVYLRKNQQVQYGDNNYSRNQDSNINDHNNAIFIMQHQQRQYGDDNYSRNQNVNTSDSSNGLFTRRSDYVSRNNIQRTNGDNNRFDAGRNDDISGNNIQRAYRNNDGFNSRPYDDDSRNNIQSAGQNEGSFDTKRNEDASRYNIERANTKNDRFGNNSGFRNQYDNQYSNQSEYGNQSQFDKEISNNNGRGCKNPFSNNNESYSNLRNFGNRFERENLNKKQRTLDNSNKPAPSTTEILSNQLPSAVKVKRKRIKKKPDKHFITRHENARIRNDEKKVMVAAGLLKNPPKGQAKAEPEKYWKAWWPNYAYIEKIIEKVNETDEAVKPFLKFNYMPSDPMFKQRKNVLLKVGIGKINRSMDISEVNYKVRDIYKLFVYKKHLEDTNFQKHLTEKEKNEVLTALRKLSNIRTLALLHQNLVCRWASYHKIITNGTEFHNRHAKKMLNDKLFHYMVLESINELKGIASEEWSGFDTFYNSLQSTVDESTVTIANQKITQVKEDTIDDNQTVPGKILSCEPENENVPMLSSTSVSEKKLEPVQKIFRPKKTTKQKEMKRIMVYKRSLRFLKKLEGKDPASLTPQDKKLKRLHTFHVKNYESGFNMNSSSSKTAKTNTKA